MKKYLSFLLLLTTLVLFAGCQSADTTDQSSSTQAVKVVEIIDIAERDDIPCDEALQIFYSDAEHNYFYPCIKSEYVIVKYSDNTEETVENALKSGKITISDLDRFEIKYIKEKTARR